MVEDLKFDLVELKLNQLNDLVTNNIPRGKRNTILRALPIGIRLLIDGDLVSQADTKIHFPYKFS